MPLLVLFLPCFVEGKQYSSTKYLDSMFALFPLLVAEEDLIINRLRFNISYLAIYTNFQLCSFEYYIDAEHVREVHFEPVEGKASL